MKHGDISFLTSLIKTLDFAMLAVPDAQALSLADPRDEVQLAKAIDDYVIPEYESWNLHSRALVREALRRSLEGGTFNYDLVLRNLEIPFGTLPNPRAFFVLLEQKLNKVDSP